MAEPLSRIFRKTPASYRKKNWYQVYLKKLKRSEPNLSYKARQKKAARMSREKKCKEIRRGYR